MKMPRFWRFGRMVEETILNTTKEKNGIEKPSLEIEKTTEQTIPEPSVSSKNDSVVLNEDKTPSPTSYYAISLPLGTDKESEDPLVFVDKREALKAVKKWDGARFKAFQKEEDAITFASQSVEMICATPKLESAYSPPIYDLDKNKNNSAAVSERLQFKAPRSQDSVKLRKAIIEGDRKYFLDVVWSNPRFLINCGDTPAILHEGYRYNALHVAAKHKQPLLCQMILDVIEDPNFMELLYPEDTEQVRQQRIKYVLDLYLNMPDKGLCESPLHFASKFGCLEAVRILASHPSCDKTRQNRYGLEAKAIICERCPASSIDLKQQIEDAFAGQYYVPVLRSQDNSFQAMIGQPCRKQDVEVPRSTCTSSPCSTLMFVKAFAGPMSPKQANMFYRHMKTPPARFSKLQCQELNGIRLCDTEKGLERFGRDLAHTMNTRWSEFWPSLNAWCDLSSTEGLDLLETHLQVMFYTLKSQSNSDEEDDEDTERVAQQLDFRCSTPNDSLVDVSKDSSGISNLCLGLQNFHVTSPEKSSASEMQDHHGQGTSEVPEQTSLPQDNLKMEPLPKSDEIPESQKFDKVGDTNGDDVPFGNSYFGHSVHALALSLLQMLNLLIWESEWKDAAEDMLPEIKRVLTSCDCSILQVHDSLASWVYRQSEFLPAETDSIILGLASYHNSSFGEDNMEESSINKLLHEHLKCILQRIGSLFTNGSIKCSSCTCKWTIPDVKRDADSEYRFANHNGIAEIGQQDSAEEYCTPPTTPETTSDEDEPVTPSEGLEIFVDGEDPSKNDIDMLRAIESVPVDPVRYPHITSWKHSIQSKDRRVIESWTSPANRYRDPSRRFMNGSPISPLASPLLDSPIRSNKETRISRDNLRPNKLTDNPEFN